MTSFDSSGWLTTAVNYTSRRWRSPNVTQGNAGRKAVVLHITDGVDSRSTLGTAISKVSAHFLNREEGVYQHVSIHDTAYANGLSYKNGWIDPQGNRVTPPWPGLTPPTNPNHTTISIENEGRPGTPLSPRQQQQLTDLLRALAAVYPQFRPYVPGVTLIGHRDIAPVHRANCPGPAFDFAAIAAAANAAPSEAITADAAIIAAPRAVPSQMLAYLRRRQTGGYTPADVETIVRAYVAQAVHVGVDPLVAVAQMLHETGTLTSWWAQRPRRNPAGIGVKGASVSVEMHDTYPERFPARAWVRGSDGRWQQGVSFASWAGEAIPAHIGRLVAYAVPPEDRTPIQAGAVQRALGFRDLPLKCHGSAPTLRLLGTAPNAVDGCGWASPGDEYGARIAAIMRAIAEVAP